MWYNSNGLMMMWSDVRVGNMIRYDVRKNNMIMIWCYM